MRSIHQSVLNKSLIGAAENYSPSLILLHFLYRYKNIRCNDIEEQLEELVLL